MSIYLTLSLTALKENLFLALVLNIYILTKLSLCLMPMKSEPKMSNIYLKINSVQALIKNKHLKPTTGSNIF